MKSTKKHFELEDGEFIVTGDHRQNRHYKIFFKDKEVLGVVALIINDRFRRELEEENDKRHKKTQ